MKHMKEIFLQDSVLLRERWPNHPNFQQPLFRSAEFNDFAKKVLAACRDPQVSYNQQIHSVVPELALELQALRREVHSDLEVFRRDWQLGHQHELRQLTGLAGMLHGATINLPAVVAPINFGAGVTTPTLSAMPATALTMPPSLPPTPSHPSAGGDPSPTTRYSRQSRRSGHVP